MLIKITTGLSKNRLDRKGRYVHASHHSDSLLQQEGARQKLSLRFAGSSLWYPIIQVRVREKKVRGASGIDSDAIWDRAI